MKNRDVANLWKRGIFNTIVFLSHVERWNVTWLAKDQWEEEAPACMEVSQILCSSKSLMDQITIKTPNHNFCLYWCLIDFIDWRYSQSCWYFRPLLWTSAPLSFSLVHLLPSPLSCMNKYLIQCVTGRGGGDGIGLCGEHLQELYTVYLTRFRTYKIASRPQTKI